MKLKFWFGVALSVSLLFLVFFRVDFGTLLDSLRRASPVYIGFAVLPLLLTQLVKAWRWKYLMVSLKTIPVGRLLPATVIGAMVDMVFPARGGDIARACLVGNRQSVSKTATLATLVVEKTWDMGVILLIAIPTLVFLPFPSELSGVASSLRMVVAIAGLVCLTVLAVSVLASMGSGFAENLLKAPVGLLPHRWRDPVNQRFDDFMAGLRAVGTMRGAAVVFLLSILLWLVFGTSNYLILRAFAVEVPWYAAVILLVFQVFGVTLPSSPGFIGTYHAAVVAGFALFGVIGEAALSVAIVMHAAFFFPFITVGLLYLWSENVSFGAVRDLDGDAPKTAQNG